jgi:hypothetical protein
MNRSLLTLLLLMTAVITGAQSGAPSRLKVYVDCNTTWCDMQYIRSEINIVDFLHDHADADVHILVTSQSTGGGGWAYDLIFYGLQYFHQHADTLRYTVDPDATEFESRDQMLKYIKAGLIPFITETAYAPYIDISLKSSDSTHAGQDLSEKDPWNGWVMRIGANLYASADANYNNKNINGNISANKITEEVKTGVGFFFGKNRSTFRFEENGVEEKFVVNNHNWTISQYLVKSISNHWSWAYEAKYIRNTFSNNKGRAFLITGAEYNVFPYKDVNNRLLTLSYALTARHNLYFDTTIYDKTEETLLGHRATAYLSFTQKWGNAYTGIYYHNYFHDWQLFNLGIDMYTSVRVAGGLSFYILAYGALTRDQLFLVKGDATPEEVLARRRQLASGYTYYTSFGLQYRFGSNINNVVNPRFDRSSPINEE